MVNLTTMRLLGYLLNVKYESIYLMEYIDLDKWPRRSHFEFFENADDAFIDVTVQLDITIFFSYLHSNGYKFFPSLLFCFLKAMNEIDEFKYRVLENRVVKYDQIHGDITVPIAGDKFAFCLIKYQENVHEFLRDASIEEERAKNQTDLVDLAGLDVVWVSDNPWFSFTSMRAPTAERSARSIPMLLFGKYHESEGKKLLPVSVKVYHALLDGLHIGRLLDHVENSFQNPEKIFS
jgi:chloramphenicol O-acetyltransferase type A